ncbi:MAG TPA: hypothetical protein VGO50_09040 [Pyrinomonadaceae bacterium]|jgi:hypothetical protein|nr:hypothetical protein [Pyrinomonadaceae bacterium]
MSSEIPQVQNALRTIGQELERMSSTFSQKFSDIIGNARWFTTLVVGEVAGIVSFSEKYQGWQLVAVIIALIPLAFATICLIKAIVLAQKKKNFIESEMAERAFSITFLTVPGSKSIEDKAVFKGLNATLENVATAVKDAEKIVSLSNLGLWLFLGGTVLAGFALIIR